MLALTTNVMFLALRVKSLASDIMSLTTSLLVSYQKGFQITYWGMLWFRFVMSSSHLLFQSRKVFFPNFTVSILIDEMKNFVIELMTLFILRVIIENIIAWIACSLSLFIVFKFLVDSYYQFVFIESWYFTWNEAWNI